jgi:ribosomal protein L16 Arg81 hydroxylase
MNPTSKLSEILYPVTEEEFFSNIYQQKALGIPGAADRFKALFSWEAAAEVMNNSIFPHPTIKMNRQGRPVKFTHPNQLVGEMREGTTLILDNADSYAPELARFCDQLSYEYLTPVRTNAYMSFPGIQAFDNHYDTHDFFILQVEGSKRWHIYDRTVESPLYYAKSHGINPPDSPPVLETTLSKGDVLYVPKGFWHYAVTTDTPSLHLTLAIFVRTGIDFLNWLVDDLREDVLFRREFPLIRNASTNNSSGEHLYASSIGRITERLKEVFADQTLGNRFEEYMAAHLTHRRRFHFPADFADASAFSETANFRRIGVTPLIRKSANIRISFHGRTFELDRKYESLIDTVFGQATGEISTTTMQAGSSFTAQEASMVLGTLCREGLLERAS